MRRLMLCLLLAISVTPLWASDPASDPHAASKQKLFQHLSSEVMLPLTAEFAAAADRLVGTSRAFCDGAANVRGVQQAWRDVQSAWQPLEMLQIGPTIDRRSQRHLNFWPVRPRLLEPLFAETGPIAPEKAQALGASGKGLPALEYLLFTPHEQKQSLATAHCNVLQALAAQVSDEARALAADWREPDGGFARQLAEAGQPASDSPFASGEQALSDVVNLLIAGLDAVKVRKLGKPLEMRDAESAIERIESWRSNASLDHIRDNLRGFELVFFGDGENGFGLDDYLAAIERPGLARVIRTELTATQKALAAVRPPLQQALIKQRVQVEAAHKALARLQYLVETEVADAMKVDLGFNANDGD